MLLFIKPGLIHMLAPGSTVEVLPMSTPGLHPTPRKYRVTTIPFAGTDIINIAEQLPQEQAEQLVQYIGSRWAEGAPLFIVSHALKRFEQGAYVAQDAE